MTGIAQSPWLWLSLGLALLLYEVFAITLVVRSHAFTKKQKIGQIVLVALVPLFGAVVAHWFSTHGVRPLPTTDRAFTPQERPTLGQR
jgi:hypothetical protein